MHGDVTAPVRAQAEETVVPAAAAATAAGRPRSGRRGRPSAQRARPQRSLVDRLGPADGRTLLVTGAAGAVGGYAVALAAHAGWTVTGLARDPTATSCVEPVPANSSRNCRPESATRTDTCTSTVNTVYAFKPETIDQSNAN